MLLPSTLTTRNNEQDYRTLLVSFLLLATLALPTRAPHAASAKFDGVKCSELAENSTKDIRSMVRCVGCRDATAQELQESKLAAYGNKMESKSIFDDVPVLILSEQQKRTYPYRAVGSLFLTFLLKQEGKEPRKGYSKCTAFLSGRKTMRTAAHCFAPRGLYGKPLLESKLLRAEVRLNHKLRLKRHRFAVKLDTIQLGFDDEKRPNTWDWASFEIREPVGEKVGYFALNVGGEGGIMPGYQGSLPQPRAVMDPCRAQYNDQRQWRNPMNDVIGYIEQMNAAMPDSIIVSPPMVYKPQHRICVVGVDDHNQVELSLTNCGLGGIGNGRLLSNCSSNDGKSGGPSFYIDRATNEKVVIGQMSTVARPDDPDQYGEFGFHYNSISFLTDGVPSYYDPRTGAYMKALIDPGGHYPFGTRKIGDAPR